MPTSSVSSSSTLHIFQDKSHLWWLLCPLDYAQSVPFTLACPRQYIHRNFWQWVWSIDTCQSGLLIPLFNFCSKLIESAQIAYVVWLSPLEAIQWRAWVSASTCIVKLQVLRLYWAVQWSWFARVNALCNLSRKKLREVAASLPGRFLSRHCFTLCITMEVEPRIVKQYKCHHRCSCKNYRGKGMEGVEKVSLCSFLADQKIGSSWKKCVWGILLHEQQVIACCQTHSDYGPPKMSLKLAA